jgi:hypothetical protein
VSDHDHDPDRARQEQILSAIAKVVGVALVIGLLIGIGSYALVKGLGLNSADTNGPSVTVGSKGPVTLPTTALPSPTGTATGTPTDSATDGFPGGVPTQSVKPSPGDGALFLNASPLFVKPMEKVYLTGQWPGKDAVSLVVQRKENGAWVDFGVQTQVDIGTFATYVLTGHTGDNEFRVLDPESSTASNSVVVTVQP